MTPSKTNRGRPKGSGLNDAAQLRAIANLMTADPDLKPTTAIRQLGIQDPSVIRRLRDKFNACEAQLTAEMRSAAGQTSAAPKPLVKAAAITPAVRAEPEPSKTGARVIALSTSDAPRKSRPLTASKTSAEPISITSRPAKHRGAPDDIRPPSETDLPNWMGVGLSLFVLGFEAQFAAIGTMFEWPPLTAVLRSNVAFTEIAVAMTRPVLSAVSA